MEPSSYSFHDELSFNGETPPLVYSMWPLSPEVNFDLTGFEFLPDPVEPAPVARHSAFETYVRPSETRAFGAKHGSNIHGRVIAMMNRMKREKGESRAAELSRGFRHMMRERQRREKLGQSYADLYAMLSSRSKVGMIIHSMRA